jgi:hypothetical protein
VKRLSEFKTQWIWGYNSMDEKKILLGSEDKYSLINMYSDKLFPSPFIISNLTSVFEEIKNEWPLLWDFRKNESGELYNDIKYAFEEASYQYEKNIVLVNKNIKQIDPLINDIASKVIPMKDKSFQYFPFDLSIFEDDYSDINMSFFDFHKLDQLYSDGYKANANELGFISDEDISLLEDPEIDERYKIVKNEMEEYFYDIINVERKKVLDSFLRNINSNSLLMEIAIFQNGNRKSIIPYHSFSIHNVEVEKDNCLKMRPGRISSNYYSEFRHEIKKLEDIINKDTVSENEIEKLLRENPLFLRGLNYKKVYPKIILPRENDRDLIPDIIVEPMGDEWCDLIELKKPTQKILKGNESNRSIGYAITDGINQLERYSAYFDDVKNSKYIKEKYGIKCYKPRMVLIIGRDTYDMNNEEIRRALTAYRELEIVTYDKLLRAAKNYLLI